MEAQPKDIRLYKTAEGKPPFKEWLGSLKSLKIQTIVEKGVNKIRCGLLTSNNSRSVGSGVFELKIDYGSGYRVYFGQTESAVVLLCGSDKGTQNQDIQKAKEYWADYEKRESAN